MKKLAIYYPYFTGGGAEAVALWILQALQEQYDLTLFTIGKVDFHKLNSLYGTNLSEREIKVKTFIPLFLTSICYFLLANNNSIRMTFIHLLIRFFKQNSASYDLVISAYNAMDLGQQGIQYIHWVKVVEGNKFHHKISNFSEKQLKENMSLTNSQCVSNAVKEVYGINSQVVFPPVVMEAPNISWIEKEDAFICSGRLVKAKEPHKVIQILKLVRDRGFNIKLYITGGGGGIYQWQYNRFLKQLVAENSSWINLYENLPYKDYMDILAKCKYGIHYKKEPFGISIAEMVKAGAIPFVRGTGGQVEVVGDRNQELFFDNEGEAVEKIIAVLKNSTIQNQLLQSLEDQKKLFSTQRFMSEINEVVGSYFNTSVSI